MNNTGVEYICLQREGSELQDTLITRCNDIIRQQNEEKMREKYISSAALKYAIRLGQRTANSCSYVMLRLLNTLWTGHADLRLYITTVQDG